MALGVRVFTFLAELLVARSMTEPRAAAGLGGATGPHCLDRLAVAGLAHVGR